MVDLEFLKSKIDRYNPYPSFRPNQRRQIEEVLEAYAAGTQVTTLNVPTAGGKCHGPDVPILMFDGSIKTADSIVPGDKLMGPDSKPRNVVSVSRGVGPMYMITPTWGESFTCNGDHVLNLRNSFEEGPMYRFGDTINISLDEYLGKSKNFKHHMKLWRTGVEFDHRDVIWSPYFIGLWIGDGNKTGSICITNPDSEILDFIKAYANEIGYTWKIHDNQRSEPAEYICVQTYDDRGHPKKAKQMSTLRYYILNNCIIDGEKRIPREYMINDRETRLQILAGIVDTDGYLHNSSCYEVITKYDGLSNDIMFLARSLGFEARHSLKTAGIKSTGFEGIYHKIIISGEVCEIPCKVARKKCSYVHKKRVPLVSGFRVDPIGDEEYYGFLLDGDGLYLLGDFVVTHNSLTGYVIGNIFANHILKASDGEKAVYTTPLINLVNQLDQNDLFTLPTVLGKNKYKCILYDELTAADCPYETLEEIPGSRKVNKRAYQVREKCKRCPYREARDRFNAAPFGAETFTRFYTDASKRSSVKMLFVDESANLFDHLISESTFELPTEVDPNDLYKSLGLYLDTLEDEIHDRATNMGAYADKLTSDPDNIRLQRQVKTLKSMYMRDVEKAEKCRRAMFNIYDKVPYIVYVDPNSKKKKEDNKKTPLCFKLLDAKSAFKSIMKDTRFIVLASGTPTSQLLVGPDIKHRVITMPHSIPVDQRLIYYHGDVGSARKKDRMATAPKAAIRIMDIHMKFQRHTIVHCGTYEYAKAIGNELLDYHPANKIIIQKEHHREECLRKWMDTPDSIFLCVKFAEGLDLAGDEYPVGIVAGMPFENIGDEWIRKRNALDGELRYNLQVACGIVQAAGRNTRTETDFGEVHIIDNSFGWHFKRYRSTFYNYPWFISALRGM